MRAYKCNIVIADSDPQIMRRVVVPANITFSEFADVIDEVFGWGGYAPKNFEIPGLGLAILEPEEDETYIDEYMGSEESFVYTYGKANRWVHEIVLTDRIEDYEKDCPRVLSFSGENPGEDLYSEPFDLIRINAVLKEFYAGEPEGDVPVFYNPRTLTLAELLSFMEEEDFEDTADAFGMDPLEVARNEQRVQAVKLAERMLAPETFRETFLALHDEEIAAFEKTAARGVTYYSESTEEEEELEQLLATLVGKGYLGMRDDGGVDVPRDVYARYLELADDAFSAKRKSVSWLIDCMETARELYGVVPVAILVRMYNKHPDFEMKAEELIGLYRTVPTQSESFEFTNETFVDRTLRQTGKGANGVRRPLFDLLQEEQRDKPYYLPGYTDIVAFMRMGCFRQPALADFLDYLSAEKEVDDEEVVYLAVMLQHLIRQGGDAQAVLGLLDELEIEFTKEESEGLPVRIENVRNTTRMLEHRGHTPLEILSFGR